MCILHLSRTEFGKRRLREVRVGWCVIDTAISFYEARGWKVIDITRE